MTINKNLENVVLKGKYVTNRTEREVNLNLNEMINEKPLILFDYLYIKFDLESNQEMITLGVNRREITSSVESYLRNFPMFPVGINRIKFIKMEYNNDTKYRLLYMINILNIIELENITGVEKINRNYILSFIFLNSLISSKFESQCDNKDVGKYTRFGSLNVVAHNTKDPNNERENKILSSSLKNIYEYLYSYRKSLRFIYEISTESKSQKNLIFNIINLTFEGTEDILSNAGDRFYLFKYCKPMIRKSLMLMYSILHSFESKNGFINPIYLVFLNNILNKNDLKNSYIYFYLAEINCNIFSSYTNFYFNNSDFKEENLGKVLNILSSDFSILNNIPTFTKEIKFDDIEEFSHRLHTNMGEIIETLTALPLNSVLNPANRLFSMRGENNVTRAIKFFNILLADSGIVIEPKPYISNEELENDTFHFNYCDVHSMKLNEFINFEKLMSSINYVNNTYLRNNFMKFIQENRNIDDLDYLYVLFMVELLISNLICDKDSFNGRYNEYITTLFVYSKEDMISRLEGKIDLNIKNSNKSVSFDFENGIIDIDDENDYIYNDSSILSTFNFSNSSSSSYKSSSKSDDVLKYVMMDKVNRTDMIKLLSMDKLRSLDFINCLKPLIDDLPIDSYKNIIRNLYDYKFMDYDTMSYNKGDEKRKNPKFSNYVYMENEKSKDEYVSPKYYLNNLNLDYLNNSDYESRWSGGSTNKVNSYNLNTLSVFELYSYDKLKELKSLEEIFSKTYKKNSQSVLESFNNYVFKLNRYFIPRISLNSLSIFNLISKELYLSYYSNLENYKNMNSLIFMLKNKYNIKIESNDIEKDTEISSSINLLYRYMNKHMDKIIGFIIKIGYFDIEFNRIEKYNNSMKLIYNLNSEISSRSLDAIFDVSYCNDDIIEKFKEFFNCIMNILFMLNNYPNLKELSEILEEVLSENVCDYAVFFKRISRTNFLSTLEILSTIITTIIFHKKEALDKLNKTFSQNEMQFMTLVKTSNKGTMADKLIAYKNKWLSFKDAEEIDRINEDMDLFNNFNQCVIYKNNNYERHFRSDLYQTNKISYSDKADGINLLEHYFHALRSVSVSKNETAIVHPLTLFAQSLTFSEFINLMRNNKYRDIHNNMEQIIDDFGFSFFSNNLFGSTDYINEYTFTRQSSTYTESLFEFDYKISEFYKEIKLYDKFLIDTIFKMYKNKINKLSYYKFISIDLRKYLKKDYNYIQRILSVEPIKSGLFFLENVYINKFIYNEFFKMDIEDILPKKLEIKDYNGEYNVHFHKHDDPICIKLGNITNCCQTIGGAAQTSVEEGILNPYSGFISVQKDGKIIAQSWIWLDIHKNVLVLDSIESKFNDLIDDISRAIVEWSKEQKYKIAIGCRWTKISNTILSENKWRKINNLDIGIINLLKNNTPNLEEYINELNEMIDYYNSKSNSNKYSKYQLTTKNINEYTSTYEKYVINTLRLTTVNNANMYCDAYDDIYINCD